MDESKYNLQMRTLEFGKQIVRFCKSIKCSPITSRIIDQLIRSGTSVGANYMEAINASRGKTSRINFLSAKKRHKKQNIG